MRICCLLALTLLPSFLAVRRSPRQAGAEEILEMADSWIMDFDEDDDEQLSLPELGPLLAQMAAGHDATMASKLTAGTLMDMADGDADGMLTRNECVDLLRRMKGFDGGHLSRDEAQKPKDAPAQPTSYGESHAERVRKRKGSRKMKAGAKAKAKAKDDL
mmetsp:Transcript_28612/g.73683  ORF Transcript_28612/g.73683 Transcript_28612/m.73683 type:complete len:160 (+) Transcript_28612:1229-1708(+)